MLRLMQEHPKATREELFELFQIVVEGDSRVHESLTLRIFDDMKEFDPSRASYVIKQPARPIAATLK
jgi:hypothetical protein